MFARCEGSQYAGRMADTQPTVKQREFVRLVVGGSSLADAYRSAYTVGAMKAETIRREAHRLSRSHTVSTMLDAARVAEARGAERNLSLRRRWILERLVGEAEDSESPPASRVRALELLARQAGLFDSPEDRTDKRQSATEEELTAELESRLGAILQGGSIDVTPESVGDPRVGAKTVEVDPTPP